MRRKKYLGWVIKMRVECGQVEWVYFSPGKQGPFGRSWPYATSQRDATRFKSRTEAELAILPRVEAGYVGFDALKLHRIYKWVNA